MPKDLAVQKTCLIFAPAFTSETRAIAKGFFKKIFQNIFEKDLAVSKIVLTFAPLSAPKKSETEN